MISHLAIAISRLVCRACPGLTVAPALSSCKGRFPAGVSLRSFCRYYVGALQFINGAPSEVDVGQVVSLTFGSLCSGLDHAADAMPELAEAFTEKFAFLQIKVEISQAFKCESEDALLGLEVRLRASTVYSDVLKLPVSTMASTDILIFGSSCRNLSSHNTASRRPLTDIECPEENADSMNRPWDILGGLGAIPRGRVNRPQVDGAER